MTSLVLGDFDDFSSVSQEDGHHHLLLCKPDVRVAKEYSVLGLLVWYVFVNLWKYKNKFPSFDYPGGILCDCFVALKLTNLVIKNTDIRLESHNMLLSTQLTMKSLALTPHNFLSNAFTPFPNSYEINIRLKHISNL